MFRVNLGHFENFFFLMCSIQYLLKYKESGCIKRFLKLSLKAISQGKRKHIEINLKNKLPKYT